MNRNEIIKQNFEEWYNDDKMHNSLEEAFNEGWNRAKDDTLQKLIDELKNGVEYIGSME